MRYEILHHLYRHHDHCIVVFAMQSLSRSWRTICCWTMTVQMKGMKTNEDDADEELDLDVENVNPATAAAAASNQALGKAADQQHIQDMDTDMAMCDS